jgi:hypothetical protein
MAERLGEMAPRQAGARDPHHRFKEEAIVLGGGVGTGRFGWQQGISPRPLFVLVVTNLRPSCVRDRTIDRLASAGFQRMRRHLMDAQAKKLRSFVFSVVF